MKKKILLGACAALFLGAGITIIFHSWDNDFLNQLGMDDVESIAACEIVTSSGVNLGECIGSTGSCSIPLYQGSVLTCSGFRAN